MMDLSRSDNGGANRLFGMFLVEGLEYVFLFAFRFDIKVRGRGRFQGGVVGCFQCGGCGGRREIVHTDMMIRSDADLRTSNSIKPWRPMIVPIPSERKASVASLLR